MNIDELITRFSVSTETRRKAIFSTLFIASNRLQTLFDKHIPGVTLKQFMLLSLVRQPGEQMTFTQLGSLLGCSRQNIKKLASALMRKGFITIHQSPGDPRALCIYPTEKVEEFFRTDFAAYEKELKYLFAVYSEAEIETLFVLLSKLYTGIDTLERRIDHEDCGNL